MKHSLDDPVEGLPERERPVAHIVEVQLVGDVAGGLQKTVKLALHHLILVLRHLLQTDGQSATQQSHSFLTLLLSTVV